MSIREMCNLPIDLSVMTLVRPHETTGAGSEVENAAPVRAYTDSVGLFLI